MTGWMDDAACRGMDAAIFFHAEDRTGKRTNWKPALAVCARCEVRVDCLAHAVAEGELYGVWGGRTEAQRLAARGRERRLRDPSVQPRVDAGIAQRTERDAQRTAERLAGFQGREAS